MRERTSFFETDNLPFNSVRLHLSSSGSFTLYISSRDLSTTASSPPSHLNFNMATPAVPPPHYTDHPRTKTYGAADDLATDQQALLGRPSSSSRGNAWIDQPEEDDLPDDFKVGVNVADCDVQIRMAFVRKIYS